MPNAIQNEFSTTDDSNSDTISKISMSECANNTNYNNNNAPLLNLYGHASNSVSHNSIDHIITGGYSPRRDATEDTQDNNIEEDNKGNIINNKPFK